MMVIPPSKNGGITEALLVSLIVVIPTFKASKRVINIIRISISEKSKLPTYGDYILWGDDGGLAISATTLSFLINVRKTDIETMNLISKELKFKPDLSNLEPVIGNYYLLTEIH